MVRLTFSEVMIYYWIGSHPLWAAVIMSMWKRWISLAHFIVLHERGGICRPRVLLEHDDYGLGPPEFGNSFRVQLGLSSTRSGTPTWRVDSRQTVVAYSSRRSIPIHQAI